MAGEYLRPAFAAPGASGDPLDGRPDAAMADVTLGDVIRPLNDGSIQPRDNGGVAKAETEGYIDSEGEIGDNNTGSKIDYDLLKEYVQDIEKWTGMKIPKNQIEELKNALRNKEYKKLSKKEKDKHRNEFNSIRDDLISQWEKNTGRKWPIYEKDVISLKTGEPYIKAGQYYDAHHIIKCSYGGDNAWWNIHPACNPDIHQSGIHGTGSPANRLFDGGYYDY